MRLLGRVLKFGLSLVIVGACNVAHAEDLVVVCRVENPAWPAITYIFNLAGRTVRHQSPFGENSSYTVAASVTTGIIDWYSPEGTGHRFDRYSGDLQKGDITWRCKKSGRPME